MSLLAMVPDYKLNKIHKMYFKIWLDRNDEYRLSLKGGNHETIFTTEGYVDKDGAIHAKNLVISADRYTPVIDRT